FGQLVLGAGASTLQTGFAAAPAAGATTKVTSTGLFRLGGGSTINFVGNNATLGGGNDQVFFTAAPTLTGTSTVGGGLSNVAILPYATVNGTDFASTLSTDSRTIVAFDKYFTGSLGGAGSGETVKVTANFALGSATTVNAVLLSGDNITISGTNGLTLGS